MKLFILSVSILILGACSTFKPGCIIEDKVTSVATDVVSSKLQCANKTAVATDMKKLVGGLGLCKAQTGPLADAICPGFVKTVVDGIAKAAVPAVWSCSAVDAKTLLGSALEDACRKIPVNK